MTLAEALAHHAPQLQGFTPKYLSCAWCDDRDRISLTAYPKPRRALNPYTTQYEEPTGPPPTHIVLLWFDRHQHCEERWKAARVRIEVVEGVWPIGA